MGAVNQGRFYIRGRRGTHHEAPVCSQVEPDATISLVHIRHDLSWVQENDQMLG